MSRTPPIRYEDLVTKARDFFWMRGYQSVTPDAIANHLGVSVSLIYNKYGKDMLFVDVVDSYIEAISNPILMEVRNSDKGLETFRDFFYGLIDAFIDKTFPGTCMVVNSVVEMHNVQDKQKLVDLYSRYFGNMKETYLVVLERAYTLGEIRDKSKLDQYADFLVGILFGLTVLYKCKSREELRQYLDAQIALIN